MANIVKLYHTIEHEESRFSLTFGVKYNTETKIVEAVDFARVTNKDNLQSADMSDITPICGYVQSIDWEAIYNALPKHKAATFYQNLSINQSLN